MDVNEMADAESRVDLKKLTSENPVIELVVESEEIRAPQVASPTQSAKTGGLLLRFRTRTGVAFTMKYSKGFQGDLKSALKLLKLNDTIDLQKNWYEYTLSHFGMGFPRYIPRKKLEAVTVKK